MPLIARVTCSVSVLNGRSTKRHKSAEAKLLSDSVYRERNAFLHRSSCSITWLVPTRRLNSFRHFLNRDGNCFLLLHTIFFTIDRWIMVSIYILWRNNRIHAILRSFHPPPPPPEGRLPCERGEDVLRLCLGVENHRFCTHLGRNANNFRCQCIV